MSDSKECCSQPDTSGEDEVEVDDLPDAELRIRAVLKKANISDSRQLLVLSGSDLSSLSGLPYHTAQLLKSCVAKQLVPQLPLNGGFLSGVITEVSGESACGKTQLCLQICLSVQLDERHGGGAVYICTEDVFPSRRLQQLIKSYARRRKGHSFGDNIFIEHVADFESLDLCVEKRLPTLLARGVVKLVVIDSVAALFRCHYAAGQVMERARHLAQFASVLHQLAAQHRIPIICVNQVSANMGAGPGQGQNSMTPALGLTWGNQVTCRIMMSRPVCDHKQTLQQNFGSSNPLATYRELSVVFAPHLAPARLTVCIDDSGIHGLGDL